MGSVKSLLEEKFDYLGNLPIEAYGNRVTLEDGSIEIYEQFDPANSWLRTAAEEDQLDAMRSWFLARYCDPQINLPRNTEAGGYLFLYGGPFNPSDELHERFDGLVDDTLIENVADEMFHRAGDEWAPIVHKLDDYDDQYDFDLPDSSEPLRRLSTRVEQFKHVIKCQPNQEAKTLVVPLVFSAAISALEAYLWETAQYWIDNDTNALRTFVTKIPDLSNQNMKLGDLFVRYEGIKNHVKGHLQGIIWHRLEQVALLYKQGFGIDFPEHTLLKNAVIKRHDIVHRSGHDKNGVPIEVTESETQTLLSNVERFANQLYEGLAITKNAAEHGEM